MINLLALLTNRTVWRLAILVAHAIAFGTVSALLKQNPHIRTYTDEHNNQEILFNSYAVLNVVAMINCVFWFGIYTWSKGSQVPKAVTVRGNSLKLLYFELPIDFVICVLHSVLLLNINLYSVKIMSCFPYCDKNGPIYNRYSCDLVQRYAGASSCDLYQTSIVFGFAAMVSYFPLFASHAFVNFYGVAPAAAPSAALPMTGTATRVPPALPPPRAAPKVTGVQMQATTKTAPIAPARAPKP